MEDLKITAVVGSLRAASLNRQLAQTAASLCEPNVSFTILSYADVPMLNQDIEFPAPAAVARVRAQIAQSDGVWFFTPEHNHYFPAALKNLIDWLSRPQEGGAPQVLAGKAAAVSGITPGMSGTGLAQDHLVTLLSFLDMRVMNAPRLTIPNAMAEMRGQKLELSEQNTRRLQAQLSMFTRWILALRG